MGEDQPVFLCTSVWYFIIIGFGITFSTLFSKTYRINKIIADSLRCKRIQLSVRETLYPVAIITVFNIIMLVLMTTLRPVYYDIVETTPDKFGRMTEIYGNCKFVNDGDGGRKGALAFLLPTIVVNGVMVCVGLLQVWRARNLSTEYSESRYIGSVLLISLLVAMFAIPMLVITRENPSAGTFVQLMLASIIPGITLFFIFIPKMMFLAKLQERRGGQRFSMIRASFAMGVSSLARSMRQQSDRDGSGEKIVTAKTQRQLAVENTALEVRNEELRNENALLRQRLLAFNDDRLESTASTAPTTSQVESSTE